jgi:hypothetical protein
MLHRHVAITLGFCAMSLLVPRAADAAESPPASWRLDGGLTLSRFEQQVKTEVGGARGERLVKETELGLAAFVTYRVFKPILAGLFVQFDLGSRSAGRFDAFDANNTPILKDTTGGSFTELWIGPLVRAEWRRLFVELGYGAFGVRDDGARSDLPAVDGTTDGAFTTSPTIAWLLALGGSVPLKDNLELVLRLEYRVRYYTKRGGNALKNNIVHGTQNLTPLVGVSWLF